LAEHYEFEPRARLKPDIPREVEPFSVSETAFAVCGSRAIALTRWPYRGCRCWRIVKVLAI
jgi:hypothetical protein